MSRIDPEIQQALSDRITCFAIELGESIREAGERMRQVISDFEAAQRTRDAVGGDS